MKQKFYRKKLANGLTILFEKRELPIISVALATKFGSSYEKENQKGIAHFIEHMLFKGTTKRNSEQIIREIEDKGGEHNAFTAKSLTAAWIRIPSNHLEFSIELLSDMFYNSKFLEEELEKERGAILEEINMYHDSPMKHVFEELHKMMYSKPHGLPALGTKETVSSFSREDLIKKHNEEYKTSNMILTIVGDADFSKIVSLAKNYFKKTDSSLIKRTPAASLTNCKEEIRNSLDQAHLAIGIHFPSKLSNKRYSAKIFSSIFAEGSSSRIFQEVREKRGLAYAVIGVLDQESTYGEQLVYVGVPKEKADLAKEIVIQEFKKMVKISQEELEKEKEKLISSRILEKEDSRNVLFELLMEEAAGEVSQYYSYESELKKVKLKDVQDLAKINDFSYVILRHS